MEIRDRFAQFSTAVGGRLYLFSHFVEGTDSDVFWVGSPRTRNYYQVVVPTRYQVVGVGLEMKIAPLALNARGNNLSRWSYDGFGEAALFVTGSIPHRYGWGLEFRAGTQYAVDSGGMLFARLEITMVGSRQRKLTQVETEMPGTDWKSSDDKAQKFQNSEEEYLNAKAKELPRPEGFGFEFDAGPENAASSCQDAGYQWSEKDGAFLCSGVPSFENKRSSAELSFADGHISRLRILVHPQDTRGAWTGSKSKTETALISMYGEPKSSSFTFPTECTGNDFMACVTDGKVKGQASWTTKTRSVALGIVNDSPPKLVVDIRREPPAAAPIDSPPNPPTFDPNQP